MANELRTEVEHVKQQEEVQRASAGPVALPSSHAR